MKASEKAPSTRGCGRLLAIPPILILFIWVVPASAQSPLQNGNFVEGLAGWTLAGADCARVFALAEETVEGTAKTVLRYRKIPVVPADNFYAFQPIALEGDSEYRIRLRWRAEGGLRPVIALLTAQFQIAKAFALPKRSGWNTHEVRFYQREGGTFRFQLFAGAVGKPREAEDGESAFADIQLDCVATGLSRAASEFVLPAHAAAVPIRIEPGWDWSLPPGLKPLPQAGFSTWSKGRDSPLVTIRGVFMPWKRLSPREGVIDLSPILEEIESNRAMGMKTGLHLMNAERQYVPDWVVEKYRAPVIEAIPLQSNQPWRMAFVPPWNPGVMAEWEGLLAALARSGIARRPELVYAYVTGLGASRGEELFLRNEDALQWGREAGLTPAIYSNWLTRRLEAMLGAFAGVEGKLAWMNPDEHITAVAGYREATRGLQAYALSRGTGYRGGGIDFQHSLFVASGAGADVEDGYPVLDEASPVFLPGRVRGDENEEYGKYWEWRFGPEAGYAYRHRICILHSLMLRQNVVMVSAATLALNPDLNAYAATTMGRGPADSPDAWCYLRECSTRGISAVKNLEHGLRQRDVPGSFSVACRRVDRAGLPMDAPGVAYDLDARRTDGAHGQRSLAFRLDGAFLGKAQKVVIKVTYHDASPSRWRLEYSDGASLAVSPEVVNRGEGLLRTASFTVAPFAADRRFPGGMDFRLGIDGEGDAEFTFVRVVKAGGPTSLENPGSR